MVPYDTRLLVVRFVGLTEILRNIQTLRCVHRRIELFSDSLILKVRAICWTETSITVH
jgi:hypothetical protein